MKLIDILVRELPKHGGWPEGAVECCRHKLGNSIDFYDETGNWDDDCYLKYGKDFAKDCIYEPKAETDSLQLISRSEYEAALAASKPEWDGEGLPPVGVNAEVLFAADTEPKWFSFLAKFIGENHVIALVDLEEISYKKDELLTSDVKFAPLRSEEDRKRDAAISAIDAACLLVRDASKTAAAIYDAIAAGDIPGVKIE
ncbi:hypothetical protein [Enterobacter sp. CPE_E1214]|uniref:hypothetical protein n=1 Tax=unclassified Enterobacter TaxID=2608935 RepID=UPI00388F64D0